MQSHDHSCEVKDACSRGNATKDVFFWLMYFAIAAWRGHICDIALCLTPSLSDCAAWLDTAVAMAIECNMFDWILATQFLPFVPPGFPGSVFAVSMSLMAAGFWAAAFQHLFAPPVHVARCRTLVALCVALMTAWRIGALGAVFAFSFVDFVVPSDCLPWGRTQRQLAGPQSAALPRDARSKQLVKVAAAAEKKAVNELGHIGKITCRRSGMCMLQACIGYIYMVLS